MRYSLGRALKRAGAAFCGAVIVLAVSAMNFSAFSRLQKSAETFGGQAQNRTYYLYSPSSQATAVSALELFELPFVKGESAVYVFEKPSSDVQSLSGFSDPEEENGTTVYEFKEEIIRVYRAQILFTEETEGLISFYGYSPLLPDGIFLSGEKINLHIAVRENRVAVGTPIIFGGY